MQVSWENVLEKPVRQKMLSRLQALKCPRSLICRQEAFRSMDSRLDSGRCRRLENLLDSAGKRDGLQHLAAEEPIPLSIRSRRSNEFDGPTRKFHSQVRTGSEPNAASRCRFSPYPGLLFTPRRLRTHGSGNQLTRLSNVSFA